jgi:hypothetical protein
MLEMFGVVVAKERVCSGEVHASTHAQSSSRDGQSPLPLLN